MADITLQFRNILSLHKSETISMSDLLDAKEKYLFNSLNLIRKDLEYCQHAKKFHASKSKMLAGMQKLLALQSQNLNDELKQLEIADDIETNDRATILRDQTDINKRSNVIINAVILNNNQETKNLADAEKNNKAVADNNKAVKKNHKKSSEIIEKKAELTTQEAEILKEGEAIVNSYTELAVQEAKAAGSTTKELLERQQTAYKKFYQGVNFALGGKIFGDQKWDVVGNHLNDVGPEAAKLLGMGIRDKILSPFKKAWYKTKGVFGFVRHAKSIIGGIFTNPFSKKGKAAQEAIQASVAEKLQKKKMDDATAEAEAKAKAEEHIKNAGEKGGIFSSVKAFFSNKAKVKNEETPGKSDNESSGDTNSSIDEVEKVQRQTEYQEKVISLLSIIAGKPVEENTPVVEKKEEKSSSWMDLIALAWKFVPESWKKFGNLIKNKVVDFSKFIWNGIKTVFTKISKFFVNIGNKIKSGISSLFGIKKKSKAKGKADKQAKKEKQEKPKKHRNKSKRSSHSFDFDDTSIERDRGRRKSRRGRRARKGGKKLASRGLKSITSIAKSAGPGVMKAAGSGLMKGGLKGGLRLGANALKAIPGLGLAVTAGMAAFDAVDGWKNAAAISGKKEKDVTTTDKVMSATASALSGLTFGLVDSKTMFKGVEWVKNMSIVGMFENFSKLDENATKLTGKAKEDLTFLDKSKAYAAESFSQFTFGLVSSEKAFGFIESASNAMAKLFGYKKDKDKNKSLLKNDTGLKTNSVIKTNIVDNSGKQILSPARAISPVATNAISNQSTQNTITNITNNTGLASDDVRQIVNAINNQKHSTIPVFVPTNKGAPVAS